MSYEKQQCGNNYLLLKPDEANFSDFFRFLFSPEYSETCSFIECPLEKHKLKGDFWRRWYIFISLFSQKLLLKVETPMVQIGKGLELCLNLPSSNGGLLKLLTKVLTGLANFLIHIYILFYINWASNRWCRLAVVNLWFHIYNLHACMQ